MTPKYKVGDFFRFNIDLKYLWYFEVTGVEKEYYIYRRFYKDTVTENITYSILSTDCNTTKYTKLERAIT